MSISLTCSLLSHIAVANIFTTEMRHRAEPHLADFDRRIRLAASLSPGTARYAGRRDTLKLPVSRPRSQARWRSKARPDLGKSTRRGSLLPSADRTNRMPGWSIDRTASCTSRTRCIARGGGDPFHAHLFTLLTCQFGKHGLPHSPSFRGIGPRPDGRTSFSRWASAAPWTERQTGHPSNLGSLGSDRSARLHGLGRDPA